jgi:asparagine synthase (glutamine-hydrolysing)
MCGIVGAMSMRDGAPVDGARLAMMRDVMQHRGPDGSGLWMAPDQRVGFGHRRLAIIDLSDAAAQPMADPTGQVVLTYNGEIYNHAELRKILEGLGRRFVTDHSDTEVLLNAYLQWGIGCIEHFRGMFAFAIWDARSRELWLVRDRVGVKPLYWTRQNNRLLFASEIKALIADPAVPRAIDEDALFHYLSFLTAPAPNTLFAGVNKLPGGTLLRCREDGTIEERRWWDVLGAVRPLTSESDDDIAERLIEELRTAVMLRKVSDVPVGVFLSGGIDSSTNAVLFSEDGGAVKTFSIGYEGEYASYSNELDYARKVARQVNAEHHELKLTERDLIDFLPRMVALQDEPIGDPVCVPLYYVSKLARDNGVIVCQVGEGSDELFMGYPAWRRVLRLQRLNDRLPVPSALKRLALAGLRLWGKDGHQPYDWLTRCADGVPAFWGGAEAFTHPAKMRLLSPRLRMKYANRSSWECLEPIHRRFLNNAWEPTALNWMTYLDLNYRLPELLLMRVDKMSMGASLEARVPFLDYKFIELAMGIPEQVKTRNGALKHILKKAVRGLIPDEIIDRPKQGFGVPVQEWMMGGLGDFTREIVEKFARETDVLDRKAVNAVLASNRTAEKWQLLNMAMWWRGSIA